jgi:hypothetical protein
VYEEYTDFLRNPFGGYLPHSNHTKVVVAYRYKANRYNLSAWMFWDGDSKKITELTLEELDCAISQVKRGVPVGGQESKIISLEKERAKRRKNMQLMRVEKQQKKEEKVNRFMRRLKKGKKDAKSE